MLVEFDRIRKLPKYHRRIFITLLIVICVVLAGIDYLFLQNPASALHPLSHYVQAIVDAIFVGLIVLWLFVSFTPYDEGGGLEQIEPNRITAEFEEMLKDVQRWRYRGNFGRYGRGKVLPTLSGRQNAHASISVIDPMNASLCQQHAEYRNSIQGIDKGRNYTADTVALEVIVTIIHCAWYVTRRAIDIDLYLSSVFDPVRIDSNDDAMVLTVEDRRSSALKLTKKHFMYTHFEQQMLSLREQARRVDLAGLASTLTIPALTTHDVEEYLRRIGMAQLCARLTPQVILDACRESRNPYEN
jgi:hypothetical protein